MSDAPLDENKIVAELFTGLLKEYGTTVTDWVKSPIGKLIDAYKYSMTGYLNATLERCSRVKTFLNRDEPISLLDVYVQTTFKCDEQLILDDELISNLSDTHNLAILGSAGSGKSMFMKYLFIKLSTAKKRMPVLIELRRLAGSDSESLIDFIYAALVTPGARTTQEQLINGLGHGLFTLILDGFDEIEIDQRIRIEKEILDLRDRFAKLSIIISSRDDDRFSSWVNFKIFHVQPLRKIQIIDLISRSKYDEEVKHKFIQAVEQDIYDRHQSFLSNPLLAVMMLITFREIAHIPDKLHIFYEQAFDALYFKHDATKEAAFRRKMHTDLPIDEFKRCLSYFCIATYLKERFSFTESQLNDDLTEALKRSSVSSQADKLLTDLLESVCMLQRDGLQIVFAHRSFQEYFAAYFIVKCPTQIDRLMDILAQRQSDIVISLVFDMNRSRLEREWILPKLRELVSLLRSTTNIKKLFNIMFGEVSLLFKPRGNNRHQPYGYTIPQTLIPLFASLYKLPIHPHFIYTDLYHRQSDLEPYIRHHEEYKDDEDLNVEIGGRIVATDLSDEIWEKTALSSKTKEAKTALCQLLEAVTHNVEREEQLILALCSTDRIDP
jgi:predicted NACHT family NTPase